MKILICGDRNWNNSELIRNFLLTLSKDTIIIEGEANGADKIAREEAEKIGMKVERYPAEWEKYGRAAGPIRNTEMRVKGKPDKVVAFHNDIFKSKGTKNMIEQAKKFGILTEIRTEADKE